MCQGNALSSISVFSIKHELKLPFTILLHCSPFNTSIEQASALCFLLLLRFSMNFTAAFGDMYFSKNSLMKSCLAVTYPFFFPFLINDNISMFNRYYSIRRIRITIIHYNNSISVSTHLLFHVMPSNYSPVLLCFNVFIILP